MQQGKPSRQRVRKNKMSPLLLIKLILEIVAFICGLVVFFILNPPRIRDARSPSHRQCWATKGPPLMPVCPCKTSRVEGKQRVDSPRAVTSQQERATGMRVPALKGSPSQRTLACVQLCLTSCWWLGTSRGEMGVSMPWESSHTL